MDNFEQWAFPFQPAIISPLSVPVSGRKKFILNLNNYRNANHFTLNTAKVNYKAIVSEQIRQLDPWNKIKVKYVLYPKTHRRTDIGNVTAVHKKFIEDALTDLKIIPDDNYKHVVASSEEFGNVDKSNGRVEIFILGVE